MNLPRPKANRKTTPGVDQFAHFQVYRKRDGSLSVLGQGAMGITYRAKDTRLDRDVALKVISPGMVGNAKAKDRFLRESKAAAALQHPHVAAILFQGEEGRTCFYAMELIQGETLDDYVARTGPLSPGVALSLARQMIGGLDAAHRRGLVHGDLTPGNLMLTSYERTGELHLKIIDFGLARLAQEALPKTSEGVFGTPGYASPEHWEDGILDSRSDIYSVGAILWFMVLGEPPFDGTPHSILRLQASAAPPFDRLRNQPGCVRRLIQELMQTEPEKRPGDPAVVREMISQALLDLPEEEAPPKRVYLPTQVLPEFPTAEPQSKKRPPRWIPWALLTLAVLAVTMVVLGEMTNWFSESWSSKTTGSTTQLNPVGTPASLALPGIGGVRPILASATNPVSGRWRSTSGSIISVPNNVDMFVLVVTHSDGTISILSADWVKGRSGQQFVFVNEYGRLVTATIDPDDSNQVDLVVKDNNQVRTYNWTRE